MPCRKGCDDQCLRRIASRLCRLDCIQPSAATPIELGERDDKACQSKGCCTQGTSSTSPSLEQQCGQLLHDEQQAPRNVHARLESQCSTVGDSASGDAGSKSKSPKLMAKTSGRECRDSSIGEAESSQGTARSSGLRQRCRARCCESKNAEGKDTAVVTSMSSTENIPLLNLANSLCCTPDVAAQGRALEGSMITKASCCALEAQVARSHVESDADCLGDKCAPARSGLDFAVAGVSDNMPSKHDSESYTQSSGCNSKCCKDPSDRPATDVSACKEHLRVAMDRYEAMLRRGQCLCRSVLDQMNFNCCTGAIVPRAGQRSGGKHSSSKCTESSLDSAGLSGSNKLTVNTVKESVQNTTTIAEVDHADIERSAAREHVVLKVEGMTCTGCSQKLSKVLLSKRGLTNAQVIFVSGTAEFDLDPATSEKAEDLLKQIEKETGFKCARIFSGRQELSLLMSSETAIALEASALPGIVSIVKKKHNNYSVTYNPAVIGARSVLPEGTQLAPPPRYTGVTSSQQHLIGVGISTIIATTLTLPIIVLKWASTPVTQQTRDIVMLVLATGVQTVAVPEFYVKALKSLIYSHIVEMDMLVVISITTAYVYSVVAFALKELGIELEQEAIFETSSLLITLVLLGRLLAAWARLHAVAAISVRSLQAETALIALPDGQVNEIDARLLQYGDRIIIPSSSRVVTDGVVVSGVSEVDESMLTGESISVSKQAGDAIIAGTINGSGSITIETQRLPGENSITDIADLVENAVAAKGRAQQIADKVASWFIPIVMIIAVIVFCVWIAIAIRVNGRSGSAAVGVAITYTIAVLAISCPCALGLAVPMVLVMAGGVAARAGVIIKAADVLERGHQVTDVVFDKTGTLTEADLQVMSELVPSSIDGVLALGLTKSLVEHNKHPVAIAVADHISNTASHVKTLPLEGIVSIPAAGIEADYGGRKLKAGNPFHLGLQDIPPVKSLLQQAMTLFCVTLDGELIQVYGLQSTLRSNATTIISKLTVQNITCHIVSGDNEGAVMSVASTLGIAVAHTKSRTSPAEKQRYVMELQAARKKVLFVGDGTNDAVAIAQADVGVQIGSSSDVTGAVADVVLISQNLEGLFTLLRLSRAAFRRIAFNFGWSAVYNLFAILLASGAFVRFSIPPSYAGFGEIVSVLPVIIVAGTLVLGDYH